MGYEIEVKCDECGDELDERSDIYCKDCYQKRIDADEWEEQKADMQSTIDELSERLEATEEKLAKYERMFPLDKALNTVDSMEG